MSTHGPGYQPTHVSDKSQASSCGNGQSGRSSDTYHDYSGQSQKNMMHYSNQIMGQSNGNLNSVKNDYFQYNDR